MMNFFNRAITSIKRQPGKNLIFLLLIFILGNLMVGAIAVHQAVGNVNRGLRANIPAVVTIGMTFAHQILLI